MQLSLVRTTSLLIRGSRNNQGHCWRKPPEGAAMSDWQPGRRELIRKHPNTCCTYLATSPLLSFGLSDCCDLSSLSL